MLERRGTLRRRVCFAGALALLNLVFPMQPFADASDSRTLFHVTFDEPAYTGPVMFSNPQPGALPITDPTKRLSSVPEEASATVVDRFEDRGGSPFGSGHCLVMSKEQDSEHGFWIPFHLHPSDMIRGGRLTIEFDFLIDDRDTPPAGNLFIITRGKADQPVSNLMLQPDGRLTIVRDEVPFLVATLEKARGYRIRQVFDFNSGMVEVYLDGNKTDAVQPFDSEYGITGVDISVLAAGRGKWAIDNVIATVTDE